jgi:hypothetical protein
VHQLVQAMLRVDAALYGLWHAHSGAPRPHSCTCPPRHWPAARCAPTGLGAASRRPRWPSRRAPWPHVLCASRPAGPNTAWHPLSTSTDVMEDRTPGGHAPWARARRRPTRRGRPARPRCWDTGWIWTTGLIFFVV